MTVSINYKVLPSYIPRHSGFPLLTPLGRVPTNALLQCGECGTANQEACLRTNVLEGAGFIPLLVDSSMSSYSYNGLLASAHFYEIDT